MGTRCLTFVYESYNSELTPIVNLYRQYDGYPSGHGSELGKFLKKIVSGKKYDNMGYNGMGCLAASIVANFKESIGGIYIHPVTDTECGQDYEYHIFELEGKLQVKVVDRGVNMFGLTCSDTNSVIFEGKVSEFIKFCKEKETA